MAIRNRSAQPLRVYWQDFAGERAGHGAIPAGATQTQQTLVGHAWVVTTSAGKCVELFRSAKSVQTVVIP